MGSILHSIDPRVHLDGRFSAVLTNNPESVHAFGILQRPAEILPLTCALGSGYSVSETKVCETTAVGTYIGFLRRLFCSNTRIRIYVAVAIPI